MTTDTHTLSEKLTVADTRVKELLKNSTGPTESASETPEGWVDKVEAEKASSASLPPK